MALSFKKKRRAISDVERERLWTEKRRAQEESWARAHPGITRTNAALQGDFSRTPWLQPGGDPAENEAFANAWTRMGRNREASAVNAATIDNMNDPLAASFARTKARISSGSDMANAFANYQTANAGRRFGALQGMLTGQTGQDYSDIANRQAMEQARRQALMQLWGTLGQTVGSFAGAKWGGGDGGGGGGGGGGYV